MIAHPHEWPVYDDETADAVRALVAAGRTFDYGYGIELERFERTFADRVGRQHCLAVASGTAAVLAAFFALGIGHGDEVVVPAYTFFSSGSPLFLLGAVPVLADSGGSNGNVTVSSIEQVLGPRTRAIALTHLWGHPCEMESILAYAAANGLAVVEDCSHAHGATYHGKPVGSFGDIAVFSVGGHKAVSGGLGGVLLTDEEDLYARACLLTNFRHRTDLCIAAEAYQPFLATGLGGNFRMSPIAAVLAQSHLDALDELVARRISNIDRLIQGLSRLPGLAPVGLSPGCTPGAWYDAVITVDADNGRTRDQVVRSLRARGLLVRAPSTRPLHHYPIFQGVGPSWSDLVRRAVTVSKERNQANLARSEALYTHWMTLPVNFLWDDGSIVQPYCEAAESVLMSDPTPPVKLDPLATAS